MWMCIIVMAEEKQHPISSSSSELYHVLLAWRDRENIFFQRCVSWKIRFGYPCLSLQNYKRKIRKPRDDACAFERHQLRLSCIRTEYCILLALLIFIEFVSCVQVGLFFFRCQSAVFCWHYSFYRKGNGKSGSNSFSFIPSVPEGTWGLGDRLSDSCSFAMPPGARCFGCRVGVRVGSRGKSTEDLTLTFSEEFKTQWFEYKRHRLPIPQLIGKGLWCPHWCSLQTRGQQLVGRCQWSLLWLWGLCSHLGRSPTSLRVQIFEQSSWWAQRERQRRGDFRKAVYQHGIMFSCNDWKCSLTRRQPAGGGRAPAFFLYFSKRTETGLLTGSRQSLINWLIYGRWKEL